MLGGSGNPDSLASKTAALMQLLSSAPEPSAAADSDSDSHSSGRPTVRLGADASLDNVLAAIAANRAVSAASPQAVTSWADAAGSGVTPPPAFGPAGS